MIVIRISRLRWRYESMSVVSLMVNFRSLLLYSFLACPAGSGSSGLSAAYSASCAAAAVCATAASTILPTAAAATVRAAAAAPLRAAAVAARAHRRAARPLGRPRRHRGLADERQVDGRAPRPLRAAASCVGPCHDRQNPPAQPRLEHRRSRFNVRGNAPCHQRGHRRPLDRSSPKVRSED